MEERRKVVINSKLNEYLTIKYPSKLDMSTLDNEEAVIRNSKTLFEIENHARNLQKELDRLRKLKFDQGFDVSQGLDYLEHKIDVVGSVKVKILSEIKKGKAIKLKFRIKLLSTFFHLCFSSFFFSYF